MHICFYFFDEMVVRGRDINSGYEDGSVSADLGNSFSPADNPIAKNIKTPFLTQLRHKLAGNSHVAQRLVYIPAIIILSFLANKLSGQGVGYTMWGIGVDKITTRDDYKSPQKNGWAKDGWEISGHAVWSSENMRLGLDAGYARINKQRDENNKYTADVLNGGLSFAGHNDSESKIVVGVGGRIGWFAGFHQGTIQGFVDENGVGIRNPGASVKPFEYNTGVQLDMGPVAFIEVNLNEYVKIALRSSRRYIPSGRYDNILLGENEHDMVGTIGLQLFVIPDGRNK